MRSEKLLKEVLSGVRGKRISLKNASKVLSGFPSIDLKFANLDCSRHSRCGFPEAVYCEGKTIGQIKRIAKEMLKRDGFVLLTRLPQSAYNRIKRALPGLKYNKLGRAAYYSKKARPGRLHPGRKPVLIITAGTSDIPVAEEARATLLAAGNEVKTLYDVGVAGMHRLLSKAEEIRNTNVIIVIAGMEGALASVVGGIVSKPVIAVPTSSGYGASFKGVAPLLTMLNCCSPGVSVVNIDNGFGAACVASMINRINLE
ncbi:MAG: nickel pincer cofactor biosynthesis protein LarB [Candidatus Omnitrophota bacterium]|nr:nickel pincer cofactor biosynthesis protein LarB [Candidatus Omnitrophota bacterium]